MDKQKQGENCDELDGDIVREEQGGEKLHEKVFSHNAPNGGMLVT